MWWRRGRLFRVVSHKPLTLRLHYGHTFFDSFEYVSLRYLLPTSHSGGVIRTLTLFFLLWHPLSDVWWLPTNRHRLHTNRHRLPTNRHRLPTGRHRRAYWTLRVFFFFITAPPAPTSFTFGIHYT